MKRAASACNRGASACAEAESARWPLRRRQALGRPAGHGARAQGAHPASSSARSACGRPRRCSSWHKACVSPLPPPVAPSPPATPGGCAQRQRFAPGPVGMPAPAAPAGSAGRAHPATHWATQRREKHLCPTAMPSSQSLRPWGTGRRARAPASITLCQGAPLGAWQRAGEAAHADAQGAQAVLRYVEAAGPGARGLLLRASAALRARALLSPSKQSACLHPQG